MMNSVLRMDGNRPMREALRRFLPRLAVVAGLALAVTACSTTTSSAPRVKPTTVQNAPPSVLFSKYSRFDLKPITLAPAYAENPAHLKAASLLQSQFNERITPILKNWSGFGGWGRQLVITPRIEQIRYVDSEARDWGGMFKGSPAILVKIKFTDAGSNKVIAETEFFQRAGTVSGSLGMGKQNDDMLVRLTSLVAKYHTNNYKQYVGGDSGATFEDINNVD